MSLKRVIKSDQDFIKLFNEIPDVTKLFKSMDNGGIFKDRKMFSPPIKGSNPQDVGTAYDFWLRAYIQKINNFYVENELPDVIRLGIEEMNRYKVYKEAEIEFIAKGAKKAWDIRKDYILGESVEETRFAKALLFLAYIEDFFRSRSRVISRRTPARPIETFVKINEGSVKDLMNLMSQKNTINKYFATRDINNLYLNPTFGESAHYINGADGDLIIDDFLVDFKTDKRMSLGINNQYLYQIIGYYILSTENRLVGNPLSGFKVEEPYEVNKIGFYFARFDYLTYIEIEDLKNAMEDSDFTLEQLINEFKDLAEDKYNGVI